MEDTSFRVTTDADKPMESLVASIESVGLLSPPILRPLVEGRFQVVSGFRRLRALLSLGRASAECRIVEDGAEDPLTCLKLGIADNASRRNLNPVEQALAVDRILAFVRDTDRGCVILSSLGVPVNPLLAGKLKTLLSLPRPILDYVAREAVAFPVALFLAGLNESDALILADIFADLRLGTNKQREVAVLAQEIAAREETSISGLLEKDGEIRMILEDPEEDRGLKAARLRVCLEKRRFPVLSRWRGRAGLCQSPDAPGQSHAQ